MHEVDLRMQTGAISFRCEADDKVLISTWSGLVTDRIMLQHYRAYFATEGFSPSRPELADLRDVTANLLTTTGLHKMVSLVKSARRSGRSAILATSDVSYGIARMYAVLNPDGDERVGVFREAGPALKWLGAPPDLKL
jgi:hypothetical protein